MDERLLHLTSQDVCENMVKLTPEASHTQEITQSLQQTVYGQDEACRAVARRVSIFEAGLNDTDRPLGVEMFLGPTGTGKTEMAHALAQYFFDDRNSEQLKIIDCAEFAQDHTITRLTGSPPSYVGYGAETLISQDFLAHRNILVFDEIEKAHPALHRLLLGIMEDGRLRKTGRGGQEELSFANSLIIMTSNVGAHEAQELKENGRIGFGQTTDNVEGVTRQISMEGLKRVFAPEFINRIDDIVVFKELGQEQFDRIFYKFLNEINEGVASRNSKAPFIGATVEFKDYILTLMDRRFGARDMRRHIDRELLENIADIFMNMKLTGQVLIANREGDQTCFYTEKLPTIGDSIEMEEDEFYGASCEVDDYSEWEDMEADVQPKK